MSKIPSTRIEEENSMASTWLKDRWLPYMNELQDLIPIIKHDENWYNSQRYQTLMAKLPTETSMPAVEKDLRGAPLSETYLVEANLSGAYLGKAIYTTDELFNRLTKRVRFSITEFQAVDTTKVNGSTNPVLKRHIEDYQFIMGFKEKSFFHRYLFYPLWKGTSDCGRSLLLWLTWSLGFVGLFAAVYSHHLDWFTTTTTKQPSNLDWFNVLYFSVVTFTTLGLGDISAKLDNRYAQGWVMGEVIVGYIMLGGLISIFANKLARRA